MKINKSINYEDFKFADFNREVNKTNLKKLVELNRNQNRLQYFPILVDENKVIIDGQHRFMACKELGYPVYYIINNKEVATPDLVYSVNIAGKKHTLSDRIIMLSKNGNPAALKVLKLANRYNKLFIVTILEVMYLKHSNLAQSMLEQAIDPLKVGLRLIANLNELPCQKVSNRFARACVSIIRENPDLIDKFFERITINWHMVFDAGKEVDVRKNLIAAYNKGLNTKNKISVKL